LAGAGFSYRDDYHEFELLEIFGRVEKLLNERPVRKFNYKTPNQVLQEKIALIT